MCTALLADVTGLEAATIWIDRGSMQRDLPDDSRVDIFGPAEPWGGRVSFLLPAPFRRGRSPQQWRTACGGHHPDFAAFGEGLAQLVQQIRQGRPDFHNGVALPRYRQPVMNAGHGGAGRNPGRNPFGRHGVAEGGGRAALPNQATGGTS